MKASEFSSQQISCEHAGQCNHVLFKFNDVLYTTMVSLVVLVACFQMAHMATHFCRRERGAGCGERGTWWEGASPIQVGDDLRIF